MSVQSHIRVFDRIAPIYGLVFKPQVRLLHERIARHADLFADCRSVLDIGCGTGAMARVLSERGHAVIGLDGSAGMLSVAKRLNHDLPIDFRQGDALVLGEAADLRSDLVVASFVLHGLKQPQRLALYQTMRRLAVRRVIVMDYNQGRKALINLIEWLERGDYFQFIKVAEAEMRSVFPRVTVRNVSGQSAWYICECNDDNQPAD